jgi:hypothetical protein
MHRGSLGAVPVLRDYFRGAPRTPYREFWRRLDLMTIRNRIFWIRFMLTPLFVALVGFVLAWALGPSDLVHRIVESESIWVRSSFAAFLILILVSVFFSDRLFIRCPRCHHRFGKYVGKAIRPEWDASRINRCPHCRVHLDSPVKPKARLGV